MCPVERPSALHSSQAMPGAQHMIEYEYVLRSTRGDNAKRQLSRDGEDAAAVLFQEETRERDEAASALA